MVSATARILSRLFQPSQHLWLETVSQSSFHRWLKLGLTKRGVEDIGDVTSIVWPTTTRLQNQLKHRVESGQELLQIHFEGHSITAVDELYHTSWESFSDHINILSPISGILSDDCNIHEDHIIDEDTVLASLKVEEEEFQRQCSENNLMQKPQYLKLVQSLGPGKFSD